MVMNTRSRTISEQMTIEVALAEISMYGNERSVEDDLHTNDYHSSSGLNMKVW